jgi:hypothetical protein
MVVRSDGAGRRSISTWDLVGTRFLGAEAHLPQIHDTAGFGPFAPPPEHMDVDSPQDGLALLGSSSIKELITAYGVESVLLWTALVQKKRIVVLSDSLPALLTTVRTLPQLVWHRQVGPMKESFTDSMNVPVTACHARTCIFSSKTLPSRAVRSLPRSSGTDRWYWPSLGDSMTVPIGEEGRMHVYHDHALAAAEEDGMGQRAATLT